MQRLQIKNRKLSVYEYYTVDDNVANHPVPTLQPLRKHLQMIQGLVNLDCLLPWLYQGNVLSDDEIMKIQSEPSRKGKVLCLVQTIEKKGKAGIQGLVQCLELENEHLGHADIAEELRKGDFLLWQPCMKFTVLVTCPSIMHCG